MASDIDDFWQVCAAHCSSTEDKAVFTKIGNELKSKHFALFVELMVALSATDITGAIVTCGGRQEWLPMIERLLGRRFRTAQNVPLSAGLVMPTGQEPNEPNESSRGQSEERSSALPTEGSSALRSLDEAFDKSASQAHV